MTYYVKGEWDWDADEPLHAGRTKQLVQHNLQRMYDQSGYDIDCGTLANDTITIAVTDEWEWASTWIPCPVLMRLDQDSAWRSYTIDILAQPDDTKDIYVHAFLSPDGPYGDLVAATGVCGDLDFAEMLWYDTTARRRQDSIDVSAVAAQTVGGIAVAFCWLQLAVKSTEAVNLDIYSIHISEGT